MEREFELLPNEFLNEMYFGKKPVIKWITARLELLRERAGLKKFNLDNLDFKISHLVKRKDLDLLICERDLSGATVAFSIGLSRGKVRMISASILTDKGLFWRRKERGLKEEAMEVIFSEEETRS